LNETAQLGQGLLAFRSACLNQRALRLQLILLVQEFGMLKVVLEHQRKSNQ
jgi:hypothetical protein